MQANKTKQHAGRKEAESKRGDMDPLPETDAGQNLAEKLLPRGDIQINRNVLNQDVRVS